MGPPRRFAPARRNRSGGREESNDRGAQPQASRPCQVRKAVFPVAGLDTQLLPATKAAAKEMLNVVDKPLIHYAVEEAIAAGIRKMIFVTSRKKGAIEDHFDEVYGLESEIAGRALEELRQLFPPAVQYIYVRQGLYRGLGSAVGCVRRLVGDEAFVLILPDDLIDARPGAAAQLIDCFNAMRQPVIGVQPARPGEGALDTLRTGPSFRERTHHVVRFSRGAPPSGGDFVAAGRYVLTPAVFDALDRVEPRADGSIGLHDALEILLAEEPVVAYEIEGARYRCGTKLGLLTASVHLGLKHPERASAFRDVVREAGAGPATAM
jgi:UTP--glucose-1-phosphate uridylyltransferase